MRGKVPAPGRASARVRVGRGPRGLVGTAILGGGGSVLLTVASDLPGSPFGPHAGGLWPFAGSGAAPSWEGPATPAWAAPGNLGPGLQSAHLLVLAAAVAGAVLLVIAWIRLWRLVRAEPGLQCRDVWWVMAAWTAPLLFAAPFATQDVWAYVAQGKVVAAGLSAAQPPHVLGHSVWLRGVDPKYLTIGSVYGPGANDLSAVFARVSGGHPWIAVECWRLAVVAALGLCAWGVARIAAVRGANPVEAVVAGVANPGVLIVVVAGVHNDALMIAFVVAGVALALTKRPWWALGMAALAVTIKAPGALGLLAIAWWGWTGGWRRRAIALTAGVAITTVMLVLTGLGSGGGFTWLDAKLSGAEASNFSLPHLAGVHTAHGADLVQIVGIVAAALLVLAVPRGRSWIGALAVGSTVMALCATNCQPWYLLWALPVLACTLEDSRVKRASILVVCGILVWSVFPLGVLAWFVGLIALAVLWVRWRQPQQQPVPEELDDLDLSRRPLAAATSHES